MKQLIFSFPGNENLSSEISKKINVKKGEMAIRPFPDGETYVRILSNVSGKEVIVVCTLHQPDEKLLPLYFLCKGLKESGASKVLLIAPYLAYMRQDKQFADGEVVTSTFFAALISSFADELITIDPHLHRRSSMAEIYSIPCKVLHASDLLSSWIKDNIEDPVLIGPDAESEQWVSAIAKNCNAPYLISEKKRLGDREVKIHIPDAEKYKNCVPVLVDDIISTAKTMIETVHHLKAEGMKPPVCIGVHGIFAGSAYNELRDTGVAAIVTTNSIEHVSNKIDISDLLVSALK